jgi:PTS system cellobiose-specific IIA component
MDNEKIEDQAMLIISHAGMARGLAFESLKAAKAGNFEEAGAKMKEAGESSHAAHAAHSELLAMSARGEVPCVDLLLSHAQDHLMSAALAIELITEINGLHQKVSGK